MNNQPVCRKQRRENPRDICLILVDNEHTGHQISALMKDSVCRIHVVYSDKHAYDLMLQKHIDIVIADIDAVSLGGLAVLVYSHHQNPSMMTYAIVPVDDDYRKKLARDMGGCSGFFYLVNGSSDIDISRGMGAFLNETADDMPCATLSSA